MKQENASYKQSDFDFMAKVAMLVIGCHNFIDSIYSCLFIFTVSCSP